MGAVLLEAAGQAPRIQMPRSGGKRASAGTTVLPLHGPMSPLRGWETLGLTTWRTPTPQYQHPLLCLRLGCPCTCRGAAHTVPESGKNSQFHLCVCMSHPHLLTNTSQALSRMGNS